MAASSWTAIAPGALKEGRHRRATECAEVSESESALRVLRSSAVPGRSKFMESVKDTPVALISGIDRRRRLKEVD